jgi:hypothetical protein|tara:strand:- start:1907 stop:2269 length:363 start_codon:yes stop_codon:yes gene_type:complete
VIVSGKISSQTELDNGVFPEAITLYDSEDETIVWSKNAVGARGDVTDANDVHNEGFGKSPSKRYDFKNAQSEGKPSWANEGVLNPRGAFVNQTRYFNEFGKMPGSGKINNLNEALETPAK